jgi:hypothetical protein
MVLPRLAGIGLSNGPAGSQIVTLSLPVKSGKGYCLTY